LSKKYWLHVAATGFLYGAFHPFYNIGNNFVMAKFGEDSSTAGKLMMIPYLTTGILTPINGFLTDKIGKRL
jgi:nitrate/nitrite transporter NarK